MSDNTQYPVEVLQHQYQFALDKLYTDFKLKAGGKTVHCHRSVICTKSEYFRALCNSGVTEAALDSSITKAEDADILDSLVRFIYLGDTDVTKQNVASLAIAADLISHNELKRKCESYLISNLSVQNILAYHRLSEKAHLPKLNRECKRFSLENVSQVVSTEWFLSLSIKELEEYLQDDALNVVSEDDVIDALLTWLQASRASEKGKEDYIDILFPDIRLEFCTRSKLEALSKDPKVMDKLRLKILEYLQHGIHGGQKARRSYLSTSIPRGRRTTSATKTTSTSRTATALTTSASKGTAPSLAKRSEEKILLLGGFKTGPKNHKDIVHLDEEAQGSVITQTSSHNFSVCAATESGSLLVSGGNNFSERTSVPHVKKFSLITRTWTDLPDMMHPVDSHGSTVIDNKLFTLGGRYMEKGETKHRCDAVNRLDLHTLLWSPCPPMHQAVECPGIAAIDQDIIVMGGHTSDVWSTEVWKYNTHTSKWSKCQNMPKSDNTSCSTVVVNRKVFVLHGGAFLQYDVDVDQWHELPMPMKPSRCAAMVLKQGCLVALGGFENDNKVPNDLIQTYDLSSKKWILEKKKMPFPLCFHRAVVVKMP